MTDPANTEDKLIGQTLNGRYRVVSRIGEGGMSAVYRADHLLLGRPVALKVLNAEMAGHREAMLRFEREALVSGKIQHPNVVSASDSGRLADGSLYLVLELVEGRSLRDLSKSEGKLPAPRALAIAAQIADALDAAHGAGVVHRDLKPSNVMLLTREGTSEFVKVLDFGLARQQGATVSGEALTRAGRIFGTPQYMAPEQARGDQVDERADLYALGVILYELCAGRPPFDASDLLVLLMQHIRESPPALPDHVPEPVARFILALLQKDPGRRPKSARRVSKALRKLAVPATPANTLTGRLARGGARRLLAAGVCLAALTTAGLLWLAGSEGPTLGVVSEPPVRPAPDASAALTRAKQLLVAGDSGGALDELEQALDIQPNLGRDAGLLAAVRKAVDDPVTRDRAIELSARRLGAAGVDLLYDVWACTSRKTPATRAARKWLDEPETRTRAHPAAVLALEIRAARTCGAVRDLLPRLTEQGDERSLSPLRRYRTTRGCGFLGLGDCYKCLRRGDALEKAIAAVARRPAPSFELGRPDQHAAGQHAGRRDAPPIEQHAD